MTKNPPTTTAVALNLMNSDREFEVNVPGCDTVVGFGSFQRSLRHNHYGGVEAPDFNELNAVRASNDYDELIGRGIADSIEHAVVLLNPQPGQRPHLAAGTGWTSRGVALKADPARLPRCFQHAMEFPAMITSAIRIVVLLLVCALAACGGGGGGDGSGVQLQPQQQQQQQQQPQPPADRPVALADVRVDVIDTEGRFVEAARIEVASTGDSAVTDSRGRTVLGVPTGSEQVLSIASAGFAEQIKVIQIPDGASQGAAHVMLIAREAGLSIASVEAGGSVTGRHGVTVTFPPEALIDAAGRPVTGTVDLSMTPVDVTAVDVGAFPGLFEGNAGTVVRGALRSYGTAELLPQQGGQRLNLAPGKTAVIELPLYARSQPDGSPIRPGDAIPLWSLDPASGVWQHEGEGTVVAAAASPSGLAVRATISHFSWWNLDAFSERATVNLTVTANGEALPADTAVSVQANVLSGTGPTWAASSSATLGVARDFRVAAPATLRFSAKAEAGTLSCEGTTDVSVDAGDSAAAAIDLICAEVPQPRIVRPAGFTVTNAGSAMSLLVEIAGKVPDKVELLVNGAVVAETGPQFFYSFAWDNRSVSDGLYELTARATLNGLTRTSPALQVKVDRAPPSVTRVLPATTQAVSRATEFSVSFDEEVSPLPFEWTDTVRLSVTPQGQTTAQQVDADIAYDAETRRLTVRARVDLPPGTAGLNWGGVRDLAGNNVGSQVGATWPVDVAAPVGASLLHVGDPQSMPAVPVVAADGSRYIAHRPNGNVTVSRHDAASDAWVALAPAANERPTHRTLAFALDSTGVPHVAFTQQRGNDATRYELVLKRLVGNAWETAAPAVPVAGTSANSMSEGSLVFDTADRPIVALTDADGALQILRLEAGVLVSLAPAVPRWAESGLALQADGTPVVAVIQSFLASNAKSLCINRLVAGAWQRMSCPDSVPDATQQLTWARLALRGDEPWVAYGKFSQNTGAQVLVARHDLTTNAAQAVALPAPVLGNTADIAAVGDQILVAVPQVNGPAGRPILVQHWVAGTWTSPFNVANVDSILRLRFATQGNAVALALAGRTRAYLNVLHLP